jgi:putative transposase
MVHFASETWYTLNWNSGILWVGILTLKGKIAIKLFKSYPKLKKKPYWGNRFWARGYFVNTVGLDEEMIKRYVKYQEKEERKEEDQQQGFDF